MARDINVDFYRVIMPQSAPPLSQIFAEVSKLPNDGSRNKEIGKTSFRIEEISHEGGLWEGDIIRIRTHNLPSKAALKRKRASLELKEDEGIGEASAFLFDPKIGALAIQRNKFGVSVDIFGRYMERFGNLNAPIDVGLVLDPDAMLKLADMPIIREFEFGIAKINNPSFFKDVKSHTENIEGVLDLMERLDGMESRIVVTVGRSRKKVLSRKAVMETVGKALKFAQEHQPFLNKMRVKGRDAKFKSEDIDLLEHRLKYSAAVDQHPDPHVFYGTRRGVLHAAWKRQKSQLAKMFKTNDGA